MALHEVQLKGYSVRPGNLSLGTFDSYGIEQLHVTLDDTWSGLAVTATFNPPEGEPVEIRVPENGLIDVPAEATANAGTGTVVYCGVANGVQRITKTQGYNVFTHGNVGTTVPFNPSESLATQVLQAALNAEKNSAEAKTAAASAVIAAANSAAAAKSSENAAANSATAAKLSENAAATSEDNARISAGAAAVSKGNASASADKALASETAAAESASNAAADATKAASAAKKAADESVAANIAAIEKMQADVASKQTAAAASEKAAAASAVAAAGSAAQAEAQKTAAAKSASDAQGYMQTASGAATVANASAENAAVSKAAAASSATAAEESKQAAVASEVKVAESEQAAKASEQAAAKSAQAALESKTAAATSEVNAAASAKKAHDVADSLPEDYTTAVNEIATLKQQVANITPDDSAIGGKPWSSKNTVDMLCPPLEESGNPVVCYPVAGYPLGVKAKWEPMQEGSGTPYPAGGGKNQLNPAWYEAATKTVNGITFTRSNTGELVVNGTATGTAIYVLIKNFSYPISLSTDRNWSIVGENVISAQGLVSGVTVIRPSDNTSLYIRVQSGTTVKTTVQPQIEKGNTPTAWEPYENIRPIKGRDSVTVERCGENLSTTAGLDSAGWATIYEDLLNVLNKLPAGTYVLDFTFTLENFFDRYTSDTAESNAFRINSRFDDGTPCIVTDGEMITKAEKLPSVRKITETFVITPQHKGRVATAYVYACGRGDATDGAPNGALGEGKITNVTITLGTTAPTTYTPYIGQTNTLTLPETVYGGEVDAVTGEGQETWEIIDLAKANISLSGINQHGIANFSLAANLNNIHTTPGTADYFTSSLPKDTALFNDATKIGIFKANASTFYIRLKETDANNEGMAKAYLASINAKLVYKLATPTSFTATGAQPLPALKGTNTVLTDADSATVTGRADPIKRIEDLEAAVASIN